ncbi:hypothetical protein MNBD_NITROSPINAE04-1957 [hydrothermal vent metagenome]|uniref:Uncharacterized protein n=1 Tax=hydrothermal vent metagenome TaxID=652676 RepID=A0A3B1BU17_9ZZZZ
MSYSIKDIEDAIIKALMPLTRERGGDVITLDSHSGDLERALASGKSPDVIPPALLVTFLGSKFNQAKAPMLERGMTFSLLHASLSLESEKSRRRIAYGMMESTRALLNNNDLGLAITPLTIEEEMLVGSSGEMTVYRALYRTSFADED